MVWSRCKAPVSISLIPNYPNCHSFWSARPHSSLSHPPHRWHWVWNVSDQLDEDYGTVDAPILFPHRLDSFTAKTDQPLPLSIHTAVRSSLRYGRWWTAWTMPWRLSVALRTNPNASHSAPFSEVQSQKKRPKIYSLFKNLNTETESLTDSPAHSATCCCTITWLQGDLSTRPKCDNSARYASYASSSSDLPLRTSLCMQLQMNPKVHLRHGSHGCIG